MATRLTQSGLQSIDPLKAISKPEKSEAQLNCEDKGGRWDGVKCILPTPESKPAPAQEPPPAKLTAPEVIRNEETGKPSGIKLPDGREFLGIPPEEIKNLSDEFIAQRALPIGAAEVGSAQAAADLEGQQEELQSTDAPVRRELDPTLEIGEDFPVLGPLMVKLRKRAQGFLEDTPLRNLVDDFNPREQEDFFELQPEELKTAALSQIEINEIERGLTDSEKFGSFVESLGLGGLSNFAAEKPSENVQTILKELKTQKTRATNAEIKVKDGTWRKVYGEEVITEIEGNIQRMESRMKLLIQESPEFKFNSDGVNFIETKILESRERLFSARINMLSGATQDPTEIQILMALQDSIQAEEFEIP